MVVRWEVVRALAVRALVLMCCAMGAGAARAQPAGGPGGGGVGDGTWTLLDRVPASEALTEAWFRPLKGQAARADFGKLSGVLSKAPMENGPGVGGAAVAPVTVWLPDPDGNLQRFGVVESPVMEAALYAAHPELRQYRGQGIDDPGAAVRLAVSPWGLSAVVLTDRAAEDELGGGGGGAWYIDAYTKGDTSLYTSYYLRDAGPKEKRFNCLTVDAAAPGAQPGLRLRSTLGTSLRTYRIAVATTSEFTAWYGTQAAALTAVTNAVSQLSAIYEKEFAVRFTLVTNELALVYPASGDPFSVPSTDPDTTNQELQATLDSVIGSANYDIGHVFHRSTNENGLAGGIGTVCTAGIKGEGFSAYATPTSPFFVIDYVAHEVGHQFGARHVFNHCSNNAGDSPTVLVEPASGSTIMSYAGICNSFNLQAHNDAYFNGLNTQQVANYLAAGGSCAAAVATGNTPPAVSAGVAYAVPAKTAFVLTATGSDANGDPVTYCWEQQDGGAALTYPPTLSPQTDTGSGPLVRSKNPASSPARLVPQLSTVLAGTTDAQEWLPQVGRTMKWRVTARDNRSGGGGVNQADVSLTVVGTAGPFSVTSQSTSATQSGPVNVTWSVAGTTAAPISCANVKISLSTDGGQTFPTVLAASVPNTGTAAVVLPSLNTSSARIKVEGVGNIFYDVNAANFTIVPSTPVAAFGANGAAVVNDSAGNGNANGAIDPGETAVALTLPLINNGNTTASGITATLTSQTATASVVTGVSAYPNMGQGTGSSNSTPFVLSVSPSHPCGAPVSLSLSVVSGQGSSVVPFTIATGATVTGSPVTRSYTGPAVAIPDNSTAGVNQSLSVSGVGAIGSLMFRFDGGATCSTNSASTTVGLNHQHVGDLVVKLSSPDGTTITIMNRPGGTNNSGNNFCRTTLDDASGSVIAAGGSPWTGTFAPANPLSAFAGKSADGTWTLNVADVGPTDTGSVRFWSLIITPQNSACSPPRAATGACCSAGGSCSVVSAGACVGTYQGDSTGCVPTPCPAPTGACCAASGACAPTTQAACAGAFEGDNTVCEPNPCPQPTGACCDEDGSCAASTQAACTGATYQGDGTACEPSPCPQPTGACCDLLGACSVTTQAGCAIGTWAVGGSCVVNPCPQPTGTCCAPDGACSLTTQASCAVVWTQGVLCTPLNPCPQPDGSCCVASGACTITQQVACSGAWAAGNVCEPNPCPQPVGACCAADGACASVTQAACAGVFQGAGVACTANLCPLPTFTLSVATTGQGVGSVTSDPAGVSCPGACDAEFASGTLVTLTAVAAPRGRFVGWSGGCSGTGPCSVTVTGSTGVTAAFKCAADHNGANGIELLDIFAFLNHWFGGNTAADFNGANGVDLLDIFAFLNAWFAGPC